MARLFLDWKPSATFPEAHSLLYDPHPGITCIANCRAMAERICILVHKDFAKRPCFRPKDKGIPSTSSTTLKASVHVLSNIQHAVSSFSSGTPPHLVTFYQDISTPKAPSSPHWSAAEFSSWWRDIGSSFVYLKELLTFAVLLNKFLFLHDIESNS